MYSCHCLWSLPAITEINLAKSHCHSCVMHCSDSGAGWEGGEGHAPQVKHRVFKEMQGFYMEALSGPFGVAEFFLKQAGKATSKNTVAVLSWYRWCLMGEQLGIGWQYACTYNLPCALYIVPGLKMIGR